MQQILRTRIFSCAIVLLKFRFLSHNAENLKMAMVWLNETNHDLHYPLIQIGLEQAKCSFSRVNRT